MLVFSPIAVWIDLLMVAPFGLWHLFPSISSSYLFCNEAYEAIPACEAYEAIPACARSPKRGPLEVDLKTNN